MFQLHSKFSLDIQNPKSVDKYGLRKALENNLAMFQFCILVRLVMDRVGTRST